MLTRRFLSAALLLVSAACSGTGTEPEQPPFDAPATQQALTTMDNVLATGPWRSFEVLGRSFAATTVSPVAAGLAEVREGGTVAHAAMAAARSLAGATVPRIPPAIRGVTYVLDPATLEYVADPERNDAPSNGIRFVLYAVNPGTEQPDPTKPNGHADLIDEGDALPNAIALRLVVVSGGVTHLDYRAAAGGTEAAGGLLVHGFVSDGTDRIEVRIAAGAATDGDVRKMDIAFEIGVPTHAFLTKAVVRNVDEDGDVLGQVAMEIKVRETTVHFLAVGTKALVDGTFAGKGRVLARITGHPDAPSIRGEGGRELSAGELEVLGKLVGLVQGVFELFEHLLEPAGGILGFGAS